jgi:hypothetical protein
MAGSFVVDELAPGLNTGGFFYFLPLARQVPALAHLAGVGQPLQGLKGAAFLPAGALAIIIFLPYIMGISSWGLKQKLSA